MTFGKDLCYQTFKLLYFFFTSKPLSTVVQVLPLNERPHPPPPPPQLRADIWIPVEVGLGFHDDLLAGDRVLRRTKNKTKKKGIKSKTEKVT